VAGGSISIISVKMAMVTSSADRSAHGACRGGSISVILASDGIGKAAINAPTRGVVDGRHILSRSSAKAISAWRVASAYQRWQLALSSGRQQQAYLSLAAKNNRRHQRRQAKSEDGVAWRADGEKPGEIWFGEAKLSAA